MEHEGVMPVRRDRTTRGAPADAPGFRAAAGAW